MVAKQILGGIFSCFQVECRASTEPVKAVVVAFPALKTLLQRLFPGLVR